MATRIMRRSWVGVLVVALFGLGTTIGATSASAFSFESTLVGGTSGAPVYWCTSVETFCGWPSNPFATIKGSMPAHMVCYSDDENTRWFYVFLQNGQEGFVNSSYIPVKSQL
jgi:hypothetical protein